MQECAHIIGLETGRKGRRKGEATDSSCLGDLPDRRADDLEK